ncbi:MAG: serine hydrolase domain-containing protein [Nocardioides sp.]|uniref:serine hydrolase domain-containing protein n=1 Tax=Nocardioides sp. TaxID=35761 RepID=UPI0039E5B134
MSGLSELRFIDPGPEGSPLEVPATAPLDLAERIRPLPVEIAGAGHLSDLDGWLAETYATSLVVIADGAVVHEWYAGQPGPPGQLERLGLSDPLGPETRFRGASMTKSALAHLVGRAVTDGRLRLADRVVEQVPELAGSGYAAATVGDVITMTTGTDWIEDHRDPNGPAARLVDVFGAGGDSRALLAEVGAGSGPGTRWEYSTADSQVLDWVRERATGERFADALGDLWRDLGASSPALVSRDGQGVAMAGGGLAATSRDWARIGLLALDGHTHHGRVLCAQWVAEAGLPPYLFTRPGRLPVSITSHAGFARHWWPLDTDGTRIVADGSRGQFILADRATGVVVVKTSLWPYDDPWVDRGCRDLSYLGLQAIADVASS